MPRKAEITVSNQQTEALLSDLKKMEGLFELRVERGIVIDPSGDVITVVLENHSLHDLMRCLDRHKLGEEGGVSLSTQEPDSLINNNGPSRRVDRDGNEGTWEEIEMIISKDSNANINTLIIIIASGVLAAVGITTNEIHITIGGMLIAPGFMPIMRISLGAVVKSKVWQRGVIDVLKIYSVLVVSAGVTALIMKLGGHKPLPGESSYYEVHESFFEYWTTTSLSSIAASAAASLAGALLMATKRSTYTSGVMIGLALVPSAAIIGMSLVSGDVSSAGQAGLRWITDVILVLLITFGVFYWQKARLHKREMRV